MRNQPAVTTSRTRPKRGPGRPVKYKNQRAREKAKREKDQAYQRDYLEVRRKRYAVDKAYRETIVQRQREAYAASVSDFEPKGFGDRAGKAEKFAAVRTVMVGSRKRKIPCLTIPDMATMLNVVPKVLAGWIVQHKFPRPLYMDERGVRVFTVRQADALCKVLKEGLAGRAAFRGTDREVILELHTVFAKFS